MYFRKLLLVSCTIWIFSAVASSQTTRDWQIVDSLRNGTPVIIETGNGIVTSGKFSASTADSVAITRNNVTTTVAKSDIDGVYRSRKGSRIKRILIGAAAGAGVGTGIGILVATTTKEPLAAAGGILFGVPAGAIIGGVTNRKEQRGEVLYRAR